MLRGAEDQGPGLSRRAAGPAVQQLLVVAAKGAALCRQASQNPRAMEQLSWHWLLWMMLLLLQSALLWWVL